MPNDQDSTEERRSRADRLAEAPLLLWVIMAVLAIVAASVLFLIILERPAP